MTDGSPDSLKSSRETVRAKIFALAVLTQMLLSATLTLIQQPSAIGLAFLAGLPVFWGGIAGGIGGAVGLAVNGILSILSVVYGVRARRRSRSEGTPSRQASIAILLGSLTLAWWAAQATTTVLVIWALNAVWG